MIAAREMGQPYPSGMDKPYTRPAEPVHFSRDSMHVKPYSQNWRERRQKARVIAQAYRRRKPVPRGDGPCFGLTDHVRDELADRL